MGCSCVAGFIPDLEWPFAELHGERACFFSTGCSGMGAPEMAASLLEAASLEALPFKVTLVCRSMCDTSPLCRRILLSRGSRGCVHKDMFEFCPLWDRDTMCPTEAMRRACRNNIPSPARFCERHSQECFPSRDLVLDVTGTPCPPWSRRGLRRGLSDPRSAVLFAWLSRMKTARVPIGLHENVVGFPSLVVLDDSLSICFFFDKCSLVHGTSILE